MKRFAFLFMILVVVGVFLFGCKNDEKPSTESKDKETLPSQSDQPNINLNYLKENLPLTIKKGEFDRVYGWIDDYTILFTTVDQGISNIYTYNLLDGNSHFITEVKSQIDSIDISYDGKYVLVRSSFEINNSIITIYNLEGKDVYHQELNVFDVYIDWNPYNEEKILISTFTDEWKADSFILSVSDQKMTKIDLPNPFAYWLTKDELVYQSNIGEEETSAELVKFDINSGAEEKLLDDVDYLDTDRNLLLTIKNTDNEAIYRFYKNNTKSLYSFTIPMSTQEFDWIPPSYDFIAEQKIFLTFQLPQNGAMVSNDKDYQFYEYNIGTKNKRLVLEGMNNEPINCSSNGNICLYGYYFEKLIDLNKKEVIQLLN